MRAVTEKNSARANAACVKDQRVHVWVRGRRRPYAVDRISSPDGMIVQLHVGARKVLIEAEHLGSVEIYEPK